jgi:hypothetical protein
LKTVVERLAAEGRLFRRLEPFSPAEVGSRKRIALYRGVTTDDRYALIFHVRRKSRILRKEVASWLALRQRVEAHWGHPAGFVAAVVEAPLCSKAAAILKEDGWVVVA